ncbi:MAG: 5-formyltetrahydrofolate cyclo-ligase [Clostridiales bacterium]|nr:5-formyltetrahydrofolate cyclo-ligase [Clostridiales bacterium]
MRFLEDVRPFKAELRYRFREKRKAMPPEEKTQLDQKIANRFMNLWQFRETQTLLTYVSTAIEVDTRYIIGEALKLGKTVAVPRCIPGTREMDFYIIKSFSDLKSGAFGVLEPDKGVCKKLTDLSSGLCIVPALVFDKFGYRLGYGKGYYDRFLARFKGSAVGLCYSECVIDELPHGKYDRATQLLITERHVINPEDLNT